MTYWPPVSRTTDDPPGEADQGAAACVATRVSRHLVTSPSHFTPPSPSAVRVLFFHVLEPHRRGARPPPVHSSSLLPPCPSCGRCGAAPCPWEQLVALAAVTTAAAGSAAAGSAAAADPVAAASDPVAAAARHPRWRRPLVPLSPPAARAQRESWYWGTHGMPPPAPPPAAARRSMCRPQRRVPAPQALALARAPRASR